LGDETLVNSLFLPAVAEPAPVGSNNLLEAEFGANLFRSWINSSKVNKNTLLLPGLWMKGDLML
jgi:hypothetical protein